MDKYNCWWPHLLNWSFMRYYAVTIGQTAYYTCPPERVSLSWHRHEDKHKEQYARMGIAKFLVTYIYYHLRYGYANNPLENEARQA